RGIRTCSVGCGDVPQDERGFARSVAEHFGTQHEEVVMSAADAGAILERLGRLLDEPLADMSFVPLYALACAARRSVTVALTGDGGDELFGGYPRMAADRWPPTFARLPGPILASIRRGAAVLPESAGAFRTFLAALDLEPQARNQGLLGGLLPRQAAEVLSPAVRAALNGFNAYRDIDDVLASCTTED